MSSGRPREHGRDPEDLSAFPELADRLQQGLLNELYLGRAMIHRNGFSSDPAFHVNGTLGTPSVINTSQLYYDGNSQGGIMGGALTAVSPDFTRAALGVPAMRYSLLLPRSVDFDQLRGGSLPPLPERARAPVDALADPDAVGPRRAERLRAPDDATCRCRIRHRTRCC